jgi:uncharacterized protein YuzE
MKMDKEADVLYIRFDKAEIVESEEVSDGIILDFDAAGRVVGLEMLGARQRFPIADLSRVEVARCLNASAAIPKPTRCSSGSVPIASYRRNNPLVGADRRAQQGSRPGIATSSRL